MLRHRDKISTPGLLIAYLHQQGSISYDDAIKNGFSDMDIVRLIDSGEITFTIDGNGAQLELRDNEVWTLHADAPYGPAGSFLRSWEI